MSLTLLLNSGETRLPQARASTEEEEKHEPETSFLLGNRKEFRIGETIGSIALKALSPILLGKIKKVRPIKAETVAKAMIKALNSDNHQKIFESDQIEELVLN